MRLLAIAVAARCCAGWYVEGVRPDGTTRCVQAPDPHVNPDECWGHHACAGRAAPAAWYPVAIYCTNGAIPIVVDDRTVGCQARH